jgi:plasmid replication initiation protein
MQYTRTLKITDTLHKMVIQIIFTQMQMLNTVYTKIAYKYLLRWSDCGSFVKLVVQLVVLKIPLTARILPYC